MKKFFIKWLINTAGILLAAKLIPGIHINGYKAAVLAALALGLLNAFIRPLIIIITLPINILSLGLFTLLINTFVFYASSKLVAGFTIDGFWNAFLGALCLSVISFFLNISASPFTRIERGVGSGGSNASGARGEVIDIEVVPEKDKDKKMLS